MTDPTIKIITKEEIKKLQDIVGEKTIIEEEEIKKIKEKYKNSSTNDIEFSKLFIECYDTLKSRSADFTSDSENKSKVILDYLESIKIQEVRSLVSDYDNGNSIGDFYLATSIKEYARKNRKTMEDLITTFLSIFNQEI